MSFYLERQERFERHQKISFLAMAAGALGAFLIMPLGLLALLAVLYYWYCTWKIVTSKCPNCGQNVGRVSSTFNNSCRSCGELFVEPPLTESGKNQHLW